MIATASEAKHTPTPWVGFYDQGKPYAIFPAGRRGEICTFAEPTPTEADHTFIIRACNSHDALLSLARLFEKSVEYEIRRDDDDEGRRMKTITLNLIREALALAGVLS